MSTFTCETDPPKGLLQNINDSTIQVNTHIESINFTTPNEQFICAYCRKEFTSKTKLTIHESSHQNNIPYSCPLCEKTFRVKVQLKKHGLTHSPEKTFKCSECGKCFRHRTSFHHHKTLHKPTSLHKCPVCSKEFRLRSNMSTHFYTHLECKPYRCSCGKSFQRSWYLRKHLMTKAGRKHVAAV